MCPYKSIPGHRTVYGVQVVETTKVLDPQYFRCFQLSDITSTFLPSINPTLFS